MEQGVQPAQAEAGPDGMAARATVDSAQWAFASAGSVTGTFTAGGSGVELRDYQSTAYDDRVAAHPRGESFSFRGQKCESGTYFQSGLSLFGTPKNWSNVPAATGGRVTIHCTNAVGEVHFIRWGIVVGFPQDCVAVSRTTAGAYDVTAPASSCTAADQIVDNRGNVVSTTALEAPFSSTVTLTGGAYPPSA